MNIAKRLMVANVAAITLLTISSVAARAELQVGQPAPEFALPDQNGKIHRLSDYRGRVVVLAFYPKDFTAG